MEEHPIARFPHVIPARYGSSSPRLASRSGFALALLAVLLAAGGCAPTVRRGGPAVANPSNPMMTATALAGRLGLTIQRVSPYSVTMGDEMNTLLVMGPPGAGVIVNGARLGQSSDILSSDNHLLISRRLVDRLGHYLRRPPVAPPLTWSTPDAPPARPTGGLVVLDAGHGGRDPGAPNAYGPCESIIVMDAVLRIRRALEAMGVRTLLTRRDNTFVELEERAAIANRAKAALFLSIHADSHPKASIDGYSIYIAKTASNASLALARTLQGALKTPSRRCRGVRREDFRVLVKTAMPAALVELGYLTNRAESLKLCTPAYRQELAEAIARGVRAHLVSR